MVFGELQQHGGNIKVLTDQLAEGLRRCDEMVWSCDPCVFLPLGRDRRVASGSMPGDRGGWAPRWHCSVIPAVRPGRAEASSSGGVGTTALLQSQLRLMVSAWFSC